MAVFSLSPHMVEKVRGLCRFSLITELISFMWVPLLWPNYLPKAPPPNTMTLSIRISTGILKCHIQIIATENINGLIQPVKVKIRFFTSIYMTKITIFRIAIPLSCFFTPVPHPPNYTHLHLVNDIYTQWDNRKSYNIFILTFDLLYDNLLKFYYV